MFNKRIITFVFLLLASLALFTYNFEQLDIKNLELPNVFSLFIGAFSGFVVVLVLSRIISINSYVPSFLVKLLGKCGLYSIHILGLHFIILTLSYYVMIPVIMRVEKILSLPIQTGEDIKFNSPCIAIFMAFFITLISMAVGEYTERKWPRVWGQKK